MDVKKTFVNQVAGIATGIRTAVVPTTVFSAATTLTPSPSCTRQSDRIARGAA